MTITPKLDRIEDPRSTLEKARRIELIAYARANNITDVSHDMPAPVIRKILIKHGCTNIRIPNRPLGMERPTVIVPNQITREGVNRVLDRETVNREPDEVVELDADDLLERHYRAQAQQTQQTQPETTLPPVAPAPPMAVPTAQPLTKGELRAKLRAECKAKNIRQPRGASAEQLQELLNKHVGNAS